jgi:hypothetical protein
LLLLFHIISTLKSSTESCCIFIFFMLSSSKYFQELDDFVASLFSTFNSVTIFWLNMFIRIEFLFRSRMGEVRFLSSSSGFYSIQFHPAETTHISVFIFFYGGRRWRLVQVYKRDMPRTIPMIFFFSLPPTLHYFLK